MFLQVPAARMGRERDLAFRLVREALLLSCTSVLRPITCDRSLTPG